MKRLSVKRIIMDLREWAEDLDRQAGAAHRKRWFKTRDALLGQANLCHRIADAYAHGRLVNTKETRPCP